MKTARPVFGASGSAPSSICRLGRACVATRSIRPRHTTSWYGCSLVLHGLLRCEVSRLLVHGSGVGVAEIQQRAFATLRRKCVGWPQFDVLGGRHPIL